MRIPGFSLPLGEILRMVMPNIGEQNARLVDGSGIDYIPTFSTDWPSNNRPTTIGGALDQLATTGLQAYANGSTIGPSGTVTFDSPAFSLLKGGNILVLGMGTVLTSASSNVTWQLRVDGSPVAIPAMTVSSPGTDIAMMLFTPTFGLDVTITHTVGLQAVAGSGNLTVSNNGARFYVGYVELGG